FTLFACGSLAPRDLHSFPTRRSSDLAGNPETLLHAVALGGVYGIFELATTRRRTLRAIAIAVVSGAIAFGLTAIFLLPFMQAARSEEHTSELQSRVDLVCRLLLEKKK